MTSLMDYVHAHAVRGACTCGRCIDGPQNPGDHQPNGHTADVYFFDVAAQDEPKVADLQTCIANHKGEFRDCDPLDGKEHSYIELGAWLGDQGAALMLMGLGALLGLWEVATPKMIPGLDKPLMDMMAGQGFVSTMKARQLSQSA